MMDFRLKLTLSVSQEEYPDQLLLADISTLEEGLIEAWGVDFVRNDLSAIRTTVKVDERSGTGSCVSAEQEVDVIAERQITT